MLNHIFNPGDRIEYDDIHTGTLLEEETDCSSSPFWKQGEPHFWVQWDDGNAEKIPFPTGKMRKLEQ